MQTNETTPRAEFTIQGVPLTVAAPFAEGHVCTAGEASSLNQTLRENTRNNLAGKIDALKSQGFKGAELTSRSQDVVDEYVDDYEFGETPGGRTGDPVLAEMRNLADKALANWCRTNGKKQSDLRNAKLWRKKRDKIIADNEPALRAQAETIVAARKTDLDAIVVELD